MSPGSGDGATSRDGAKSARRHVLVVDDEPLMRWSISESFSDLGYDIEQAADAAEALRLVTSAAPPLDVVVLDLRLPDMDDLSLLAIIRGLLPAAVLILMTSAATGEITRDAEALGATVLDKPFELEELKRVVIASGARTH